MTGSACIHVGSADRTAKVWQVGEGYTSPCVATLEGHKEEVYCCEWLPQQSGTDQLLTVSGAAVRLWDVGNGEAQRISESELVSENVHGVPSFAVWFFCGLQ